MNKELLAQAHKALKGDLSNGFYYNEHDSNYLFFRVRQGDYTCYPWSDSNPEYQYICTVEEFNNYKEDNMKTVRDAVIEFKAAWPVIRFTTDNWFENTDRLLYCEELVCTREEFNTYVDLLASNMGRTTQTYAEYKEAVTTLMRKLHKEYVDFSGSCCAASDFKVEAVKIINNESTKEVKVDYTSEDFWKNAPDWAIKLATKDGVMNYWMDDVSYQLCLHDKNSRVFFSNYDSSKESSFLTISTRPQPKPAYTQEMSDNGELPSVGMECLFKNNGRMDFGTVTVRTKQHIIFTLIDGHEEVRHVNYCTCKPLTPPIELIDGKAYQFEAEGKVISGCYNKLNALLYSAYKEYLPHTCTNIKPLTIEVK